VYYSNREHQATLGSADQLYVQVIVEGITDVSGGVTVLYQVSNTANEDEWIDHTKSVTVTPGALSTPTLPKSQILTIDGTSPPFAAFGRFKITYGVAATASLATVRVVVCGRTN
jgi:hypothetical protein